MSSETLRRLAAWLAGIWTGIMAGIGFIAAPACFAVLPRADAGRVVARVFEQDAMVGLAFGALIFIVAMQRARLSAEAGATSRFSNDMVIALVALFCVVVGHFALQPMMDAAKAGQPSPSFAVLHGASFALFAVKLLAAAVLAWRLTAEAKRSPGVPSRPAGPTS